MEINNTFIGAPTEEELKHYGRKGMKWGQSIFGKKLSSLKKRKGDSDSDDGEPNKPKTKTDAPDKPSAPPKKSVKDMSDAELQREVNRLQLEQRYKQLTPEQVSKGKKFAQTIMNDVIIPAAKEVGKEQLKKTLNTEIDKARNKK